MLTDLDIRRAKNLKIGARAALGKIHWAKIGVWRIGICAIYDGKTTVNWALTANIFDTVSESTDAAMGMLSDISSAVCATGAMGLVVKPGLRVSDTHRVSWRE